MNYLLLCVFTWSLLVAGTPEPPQEVSAIEDLMREHGLLARILLIYETIAESAKPINVVVLKEAAQIMQSFIEGYHEKLEEEYIFPILAQDKETKRLVETLKAQHVGGREVTKTLIHLSTCSQTRAIKKQIQVLLKSYIHMYRVHAAREDTVAFPAFKKHLTSSELEKLGDSFEEVEKQLFPGGFEGMLEHVTQLEKKLGIYQLAQFTPKEPTKTLCKAATIKKHTKSVRH